MSLTDFQLDNYFKADPDFLGCYCKDKLRSVRALSPGKSIVFNLQNSDEGRGSHWTCAFMSHSNDPSGKHIGTVCYFDSFGCLPAKEIEEYLARSKSNGKTIGCIAYNNHQIQSISSNLCGVYCEFVLSKAREGMSFATIIHTLLHAKVFGASGDADDKIKFLMKYDK